MLRTLTAGLMMLALSGCNLGLHSAIDAAPFEARIAEAPFRDGVYCKVMKGEDGGLLVPGQLGDNQDECFTYTWDAARRLSVLRDARGQEGELKLVNLGDGLFMMQLPTSDGGDDRPFAFTLWAVVTVRDAFAILPLAYSEQLAAIGARHPGVVFSIYKPPPREAASGSTPDGTPVEPLPDDPDIFYISAGSPADIRDLARDILDWMLKGGDHPEDVKDWKGEGLLVLDQPSQPDHAPTAAQQQYIDAMNSKLRVYLAPAP